MIVRNAVATDLKYIAEINIACVPNGTRAKWGIELTTQFYNCYYQDNAPFVVAEENGTVIGYAMGYYKGENARGIFEQLIGNDHWTDDTLPKVVDQYDVTLKSLCVLPAYQGKGIAHNLVASFLQEVSSRGKAKSCYIKTGCDNLPAQHVYLASGFSELFRDLEFVWYGIFL